MFEDSPRCYICFEGGAESGQPLRRDCSCRGSDSGFAHLHCLVAFAEQKTKSKRRSTLKGWALCSCCDSAFKNELASDMDDAFGLYLDSLYSGALPQTEHIKALNEAIAEGSGRNRNTILFNQFMEAWVIGFLVLLLVDKVFGLDGLHSDLYLSYVLNEDIIVEYDWLFDWFLGICIVTEAALLQVVVYN